MRKRIPCKVIGSISLKDSILSEQSSVVNFADCMQNACESFSGTFIYTEQLQKMRVSNDDALVAKVIDSYV